MRTLEEILKDKEAILINARKLSQEGKLTPALKLEMLLDMNILIDEQKLVEVTNE